MADDARTRLGMHLADMDLRWQTVWQNERPSPDREVWTGPKCGYGAPPEKGWTHRSYEGLAVNGGKRWPGRPRPQDVGRQAGNPFAAALVLATTPGHRYVEGYAMDTETDDLRHHAWVVDQRDRVIDPTLENPERFAYCGVAFDPEYVVAMQNRRMADPSRDKDVPPDVEPDSLFFDDLALGRELLLDGTA